MTGACIYFVHHNHLISNGICGESIDVVYQCMAKEVYKTSTAKNSDIKIVSIVL
jgi:hypothetical protein